MYILVTPVGYGGGFSFKVHRNLSLGMKDIGEYHIGTLGYWIYRLFLVGVLLLLYYVPEILPFLCAPWMLSMMGGDVF